MSEDLFKHERVRLAGSFIRRTGDIEIGLPAVRLQHSIQPATSLAGSYRQTVALSPKRCHRLDHTFKQRRRHSLCGDVVIGIVLTERYQFVIVDFRVKRANGLGQPKAIRTLYPEIDDDEL